MGGCVARTALWRIRLWIHLVGIGLRLARLLLHPGLRRRAWLLAGGCRAARVAGR